MTNPDNVGGLLPCPFCGGAAERIDFGPGSGDNEGGSCIACTKCQASGPVEFGYKENFVSNWNRRELCRAAPAGGDVTGLHPATADLVARFAAALAEKLAAAERKYGYSDGWASPDWMDECRAKMMEHVAKGDPRDVAAYCAFLWHHGESTATAKVSAPAGSGEVEEVLKKCDSVLNDMRPISPCLTEQMEEYFAEIRALLRKLQQGADYVIVPREPTDEMVWAGRDAWTAAHHAMKAGESRYPMTETWRAMISASQGQEGGHASVD